MSSSTQPNQQQTSIIINGDFALKLFFNKDPFKITEHQKSISKFCEVASKNNIKVKVIFQGIPSSHEAILEYKRSFINQKIKPKRTLKSLKLSSLSSIITADLFQKNKIETVFSKENDFNSTLLQYALHENSSKVFVLTGLSLKKTKLANCLFETKIFFVDSFSYLVKDKKETINFQSSYVVSSENDKIDEGVTVKESYIDENSCEVIIDRRIKESFNRPIQIMNSLPACFSSYKEMIIHVLKDTSNTYILASKAFIYSEFPNPYETLLQLRQAVYSRLGVESVIEEVLTYNEVNKEFEFIPNMSIASKEKEGYLSMKADKLYGLIFYNIEKTTNTLYTEYNNHVCSCLSEICLLLSLVNDKETISTMIESASKAIKPKEKVILKKNCKKCEKEFEMKESELEKYIILELNYPSKCENCINDEAREKRIKDDMEKNLKKNMEEEKKKLKKEEEEMKVKEEERKKAEEDKKKFKFDKDSFRDLRDRGDKDKDKPIIKKRIDEPIQTAPVSIVRSSNYQK